MADQDPRIPVQELPPTPNQQPGPIYVRAQRLLAKNTSCNELVFYARISYLAVGHL